MSGTLGSGRASTLSSADERVLIVGAAGPDVDRTRSWLEEAGHDVEQVRDAEAALAALADDAAGLVLVEWGTEGLDGPGLTRTIREAPALGSVRIVAMTSAEHQEETAGAMEAGADDILPRADTPVQLLALIGNRLRTAQLRTSEQAREEAEQLFEGAFEAAPIGMALVAPGGDLLMVNRALCEMVGQDEGYLTEHKLHDILHPDDLEIDSSDVDEMLGGRRRFHRAEKRLRCADGSSVWAQFSESVVRDDEGEPRYIVLQVQDIRERKEHEVELRYLADHDALTGLFNRRRFTEELDQQIALIERYGGTAALMMLDLDNFKHVNDHLGHQIGDDVLREVATALRERLREPDVLARHGGDEFCVLLPSTDGGEARQVAADILEAVGARAVLAGGREIRVGASIGATLLQAERRVSSNDALIEVDLALYQAKEDGRDRAIFHDFEDREQQHGRHRLTWVERIRTALEQERFTLRFQPIVELETGCVTQYEALLRLDDQENGELVYPGTFLYVPARFGMMAEIDRWVVNAAIARLAEPDFPAERLEVNLSAQTLSDTELPDLIKSALAAHGVEPERLIFEITETDAIANLQKAREFSRTLKKLGCAFALDDFGSGFASFYYLKQLPYDFLKIDGEFVKTLADSPDDQLVVQALVSVAQGMGKKTIAEYVGDDATSSLLRQYGVDYGQGYHLGRPEQLAGG